MNGVSTGPSSHTTTTMAAPMTIQVRVWRCAVVKVMVIGGARAPTMSRVAEFYGSARMRRAGSMQAQAPAVAAERGQPVGDQRAITRVGRVLEVARQVARRRGVEAEVGIEQAAVTPLFPGLGQQHDQA